MAAAKNETRVHRVPFLTDERITPVIEAVLEAVKDTPDAKDTIQVQLNTKGYDNRKDTKATYTLSYPHDMKLNLSAVVIGPETMRPHAEELGFAFVNHTEYAGAEKKELRDAVLAKYKYFIVGTPGMTVFSMRDILRGRKRLFYKYNAESIDELRKIRKEILSSYRMKVRDWFTLSFPIGHCQMSASELADNLKVGVQAVADKLKKGPQSLCGCYVKRTLGAAVRLY